MVESNWTITAATKSDWPGIWAIFRDVISTGDTYTYAPDMSEESAKEIWVDKDCHPYVVKHNDEIVGTFTIRTNKPGFGSHVANAGYMVRKDHRGKGIAQAMCNASLKEAKRMGYEAMQFNFVVSSNTAAVELWQKMGFKIVGTVPKAFKHVKLGPTDVYIMHRFL